MSKRMYEQYIEDELEELGIEAELEDTEIYSPGHESSEPEFETQQITKIVPHLPGEGLRQNIVYNYVTSDGNQFSVTVKERPQCPSCDYVLAGENEQNHPTRCSEDDCQNWTCPACKTICNACQNTLCNEHSYGHGVRDGAYCFEDLQDVDEQIEHERWLEEEDQQHRHKMDLLEQRRQTVKDKKHEERQDRKLEEDLKHQKAELALKIAEQLNQQQETGEYPDLPESVERVKKLTR